MADIAKTISVINQMANDGVIKTYALGGATAVIFYTEPIATEDVEVFVHLKTDDKNSRKCFYGTSADFRLLER